MGLADGDRAWPPSQTRSDTLARMKPRLIAAILVTVTAAAQSTANSPGTNQQQAAERAALKTYTNPELSLTFAYPAELQPLASSSVASEGRRLIYGEDTTSDSAGSKLPACMTPLLAVGTGAAAESSAGAEVSIALFEVDARCLPAKALKNQKAMDKFLENETQQGVTLFGLAPIEDPKFYLIEGHRMYFASAQGTPVTATDVQTARPELIAAVACSINGHVVSWMLEADSLEAFNRLLTSQVDFGAGKPQALYAGRFTAPLDSPAGP